MTFFGLVSEIIMNKIEGAPALFAIFQTFVPHNVLVCILVFLSCGLFDSTFCMCLKIILESAELFY